MPVSNFSIGRDIQVVILHVLAPGGTGRLDLSIVTGFDSKETRKKIQIPGLDGITRTGFVPESYPLTIMTERGNNQMDLFLSAIDAAYRSGLNVPTGSVYTYVQEPNGSTTTTFYDQVAFDRSDAGSWKQDAAVNQTLTGVAATKQVV